VKTQEEETGRRHRKGGDWMQSVDDEHAEEGDGAPDLTGEGRRG
jgi:hypothetical protein